MYILYITYIYVVICLAMRGTSRHVKAYPIDVKFYLQNKRLKEALHCVDG